MASEKGRTQPAAMAARRGSRQHAAALFESESWLTTDDVAGVLRVPAGTLRQWRSSGKNLEYVKIGRLVRYDPRAILAFLRCHRVEVRS